jgi:ATP-binding cassette, subfamily B (MDR/TAP), member 1
VSRSSHAFYHALIQELFRETDDVQQASMAFGMAVQHLTTCFTCLILAFTRSWLLTFVILSAVPALVILQGLSQGLAAPLLARELATNAVAGTIVERGVSSIATVKAFNAAAYEYASLRRVLDHLFIVDRRLNAVWGFTTGLGQFVMMAMFVQGFWFGAKLVREGSASPGDVMAVFWACLIATSNMQMCIPHFIILAKGKVSMASLLALIGSSSGPAKFAKRPRGFYRNNPQSLRKIIPRDCLGELAMQTVSFTYPTRPTLPVLQDVTIFLPANEMTFIVGGSGSGKSTIAQLLCRIYQPQAGIVQLDNQDIAYLDEAWLREQVACVSQDCILFDMSVHDNIAMGLTGDRIPADATRAEVVEACQAALMHEFIRELPEGYDTMLGTGGANLSGGQRQRLAIARALLRDPTVLILGLFCICSRRTTSYKCLLDESTSALDATSRLLVFEAIKRWRHKKTTVVITHDLSQITPQDFVYVLQGGRVAEQGYRYDLERTQSGEFRAMMLTQRATGGFLPVKDIERNIDFAAVQRDHAFSDSEDGVPLNAATLSRRSMRNLRTFSIVAGRSSSSRRIRRVPRVGDLAQEFGQEDDLPLTKTGMQASRRRQSVQGTHRRHRLAQIEGESDFVKVERPQTLIKVSSEEPQSFWSLIRDIYPSVPAKGFVLFGVVVCVLSGAITPLFSYLLSGLLYQVSIGAHNAAAINVLGAIVLGVAAGDGFLMGFKYFLMETAAMKWVNFTRELCYNLILTQDKKWFDKSENSPVRMVQILIKDGDDARVLMAEVLGQCVVVVAMSVAGLTWALVRGWQLTLVGVAIAPIFAGALAVQSTWAARFEHRSKRAKELVSKSYYEVRRVQRTALVPLR